MPNQLFSRIVPLAFLLFLFSGLFSCDALAADVLPHAAQEGGPRIIVEQRTSCMEVSDIQAALERVLVGRDEQEYMTVAVVISSAGDDTLVVLRVVDRGTGEILLKRSLYLSTNECAQAHLVLKAMLEQFLTSFPIERWSQHLEPEPPSVQPDECITEIRTEKEVSPLRWMFLVGLDSQWPTPSGDLELTLGFDSGGTRRGVLGHVIFRVDLPRTLGEGKYFRTTTLFGLGWRRTFKGNLDVRVEIRTGATHVSGVGYETNHRQWLVALEGQISFLYRFGAVRLGPEFAVSPLTHSVHNEIGNREEMPWIRVGMLMGFPLGVTALE